MRGQENYEIFSEAFKESFKEINELHKKGTLKVDDVMYKVKIYYAADYKVCSSTCNHTYSIYPLLLQVPYSNSSTINFSLAWCGYSTV